MEGVKSRSGMLMTKGVMRIKLEPMPQFVCSVRTFRNDENGKTVTLHPVPNLGAPEYFRGFLDTVYQRTDVDKILCEDARLPYLTGSSEARRVQVFKMLMPFVGYRPIVPLDAVEKFDGTVERDPVESRMAYLNVMQELNPPVDPRARRAFERIESYAPNTRIVCPWNIYHLVYLSHRLPTAGYKLVEEKEVEVLGVKHIFALLCIAAALSVWCGYTMVMLVFGSW